MKHLVCDVCKKEIHNPVPNRSIFFYKDVDICEPCRDDLELAVKYTVRNTKPFDVAWYDKIRSNLLEEGKKKGRIPLNR